jgi:hypothetical protein
MIARHAGLALAAAAAAAAAAWAGCGAPGEVRDDTVIAASATEQPYAGSCAHDPCVTGNKLASSCDACVKSICSQDSYCCSTGWDAQCVREVGSICGQSCSGGGGSGGSGGGGGGSGGSDGTPTRQQCTGSFGNGLSGKHGRLDGYLVSIVPPGHKGCHGDSDHVHLQLLMGSAIYDVAVNVRDNNGANVYYLAKNMTIPDGTWSQGWHTSDGLAFAGIGVHAGNFKALAPATLATTIENELAQANHLSVFGTGYNASGMHLIHYQGGQNDGAIVINPQASTSRLLMLHFANQSF